MGESIMQQVVKKILIKKQQSPKPQEPVEQVAPIQVTPTPLMPRIRVLLKPHNPPQSIEPKKITHVPIQIKVKQVHAPISIIVKRKQPDKLDKPAELDKPDNVVLPTEVKPVEQPDKLGEVPITEKSSELVVPKKIKIVVKPQVLPTVDTDLWTEKYRPRELNKMIGNREAIDQIVQWFKSFNCRDPTIPKALLLSGCPGTSKTTVAHLVMKDFGYDIIEYNASDIRSKKLVEENLSKIIDTSRVDKGIRAGCRPFGIIMDEVDGMSSGDKGGMMQLIKTINPLRGCKSNRRTDRERIMNRWIPPVICICNSDYGKKIKELKKECLHIKFDRPTISDLCTVARRVIESEHMKLTDTAITLIAESSQGDFRRLMCLLQDLSKYKDTSIDVDSIILNRQIIAQKVVELNNFDIVKRIFNQHLSPSEINTIYDGNKSILPMLVHENYLNIIDAQTTTFANKLNAICKTIDSISIGDNIDKMIYNSQGWHLQTIHGICSCYIPNYYANIHSRPVTNRVQWTTALHHFSAQKATYKRVLSISNTIYNGRIYDINDIYVLSNLIMYNLLDPNGDFNAAIKLIAKYNITLYYLNKLVKIDQISDKYKKLYTSKIQTRVTEALKHRPDLLKSNNVREHVEHNSDDESDDE